MKYLQSFVQINNYQLRYKERLLWAVKIIATMGCLWFVWDKLVHTEYPPGSLLLSVRHLWLILISLVLMPLNWYLEIVKWQKSVPEEELSIRESMKAVLSGLALNWVLPFTLGDLGGRLANVRNYKQSAVALIVTRGISLCLTVMFGAYAVLSYIGEAEHYWLVIMLGLVVLIVFARVYGLRQFGLYRQIVVLTMVRYAVFTIQFALLIQAFAPWLSWHVILAGIGWVFLFRSVIPSLFGNFGVREASALVFFEQHMEVASLIIWPCLLIWMINTVVPSLVGAFLIFKLRVNIAR